MTDLIKPAESTTTLLFADAFFSPVEPALQLTFGGATDAGRVRSGNEDHFAILARRRRTECLLSSIDAADLTIPEEGAHLMVVADGIGGMKAGELASRLTIQTLVELSAQATSWLARLTNFDAQQMEQRVAAYVERIHNRLREHSEADPATTNMGTTWTSLLLLGSRAVVVHLGDSRAYLFREGRLQQITRDDTMAQLLLDAGVDPMQAREFGHVLTNSLGGGNEHAVARIHELDMLPGDQLLLCTDGLTDMVPDDDIAAELARHEAPQAACDALIQRALENGGKDNVTIVLAHVAAPHALAR